MLGHSSDEGTEPGLGWIDMRIRRFPTLPGLLIPHMGWTDVERADTTHPILDTLETNARFYFVHSYFMEVVDPAHVLLRARHGIEFAAAVQAGNIVGVQFHPEKSHRFGKQLLGRFANV